MKTIIKKLSLILTMLLIILNLNLLNITASSELSKKDIMNIIIKANNINYDLKEMNNMTTIVNKKTVYASKSCYEYCKATDCWKLSEGIEDKDDMDITYVNYSHDKNRVEEYTQDSDGVSKVSKQELKDDQKRISSINKLFGDAINSKSFKLIIDSCSITQNKNEVKVFNEKLPIAIVKEIVSNSEAWRSYKVDNIEFKLVITNKKITNITYTYYVHNSIEPAQTIVFSTDYDYGKHDLKPFKLNK